MSRREGRLGWFCLIIMLIDGLSMKVFMIIVCLKDCWGEGKVLRVGGMVGE